MDKPIFVSLLVVGLLIVGTVAFSAREDANKNLEGKVVVTEERVEVDEVSPVGDKDQPQHQPPPQENVSPPEMMIDPLKSYIAVLTTTEGEIKIALNTNQTPVTVNNFVSLSRRGFYDGTIFHRVINGFMIQGGDPKGDGTGGPGYKFDNELFEGEYNRGVVAMANSGPDTNGSQFFIMHQDTPLPKNYVIFGRVVEGIEVVDKIAKAQVTQSASGELSKPLVPVEVSAVEITEE